MVGNFFFCAQNVKKTFNYTHGKNNVFYCYKSIRLFWAFFGQLRLKFFQIPWIKIWLRHSVLGCKITTSLIVFSLEGLIRAVKSKNYAVKMCLTSKLNWSNIFCDNCFKSSSFWSISMNLGTGSRKHKLQL